MFPARIVLLTLATAGLLSPPAMAETYKSEKVSFEVETFAEGLEHPWGLAFLPDGRMLVTERPGRLRIVSIDGTVSAPIAGVPEVYAQGQGGLLDVALAPDFARSRVIYLSYSEPGEGGAGTAVSRARLGDAGLENVQLVFRQAPKLSGGAHFGSRLVFSRDGHLYITTGDRRRGETAQSLALEQGKVIRVMLDGSVPRDNPFASQANASAKVWSYGHRNLQGAALHPETGALWTVEHGAMGGDEINTPKPGRNYGWPAITYGVDYSGAKIGEGTAKAGMEQPVHYWDPSIAPSGMLFYTGDRFPAWKNNLFVGSLKFGRLVRLEVNGERVTNEERLLEGFRERIRDVRQGPDGLIYLLTDEDNGRVLRVEPAGR